MLFWPLELFRCCFVCLDCYCPDTSFSPFRWLFQSPSPGKPSQVFLRKSPPTTPGHVNAHVHVLSRCRDSWIYVCLSHYAGSSMGFRTPVRSLAVLSSVPRTVLSTQQESNKYCNQEYNEKNAKNTKTCTIFKKKV